jgi:hypothetical protein
MGDTTRVLDTEGEFSTGVPAEPGTGRVRAENGTTDQQTRQTRTQTETTVL